MEEVHKFLDLHDAANEPLPPEENVLCIVQKNNKPSSDTVDVTLNDDEVTCNVCKSLL